MKTGGKMPGQTVTERDETQGRPRRQQVDRKHRVLVATAVVGSIVFSGCSDGVERVTVKSATFQEESRRFTLQGGDYRATATYGNPNCRNELFLKPQARRGGEPPIWQGGGRDGVDISVRGVSGGQYYISNVENGLRDCPWTVTFVRVPDRPPRG